MMHLRIALAALLVSGAATAQDQWETVTPADFHGTWEIRIDAVDWTRALAGLPEKWREEWRTDLEKELTANQPILEFAVDRVRFKGTKRRDDGGEASWRQLDPTTVELWVKGQSSPMKLRKQNGRRYATRRNVEFPLHRKGEPAGSTKTPKSAGLPNLCAPLAAKAKAGDFNAAAKLIHLGRWDDVGAIEPSSVDAWSTLDEKRAHGMSARQVYACILANHATRNRSACGDLFEDTMKKARRDLDRVPTSHPMLALDLAWLLSDITPKDEKRAAMLRSWAMDKLTAENADQDVVTRAHWLKTAASQRERQREWDLAYPLFERAAKLFAEAKDVREEFEASRGHARTMGQQPDAKLPNERDNRVTELFKSLTARNEKNYDPRVGMMICTDYANHLLQDRWRDMCRSEDWESFRKLLEAARLVANKGCGPKMQRLALTRLAAGYTVIANDYLKRSEKSQARRHAKVAAKAFRELAEKLEPGSSAHSVVTKRAEEWSRFAASGEDAKRKARPKAKSKRVRSSVAMPIWYTNYRTACREAKKTGKIILADFTGSDWCGWCVKLKREVFSRGEFERWAADNVVLLEIDFPSKKKLDVATRRQNDRLQKKYGIKGYPTIVFLDQDGDEIGRLGYVKGGATKWIAAAERILAGN